jgi:hypothetical protein
MTISANLYRATRIYARPDHNGDTHWVDVHFVNTDEEFRVCSFFANGELADAYAAAINGVQVAQPAESEAA